jgi:hypothetical protein
MSKNDHSSIKVINDHGPMGFIFFLAFIGAAIYFVQQSSGFWGFIGAIFQAIVWPIYVVYHVLQLLGA